MLFISLAAWIVTGCVPQETEDSGGAELRSGIDLEYIDWSVDPGNDFFAFVNGKWLEITEIPADKPSFGSFEILREQSQEDVRRIIEASASGDFPQGSDEQKVGDLFRSFMDMDTRNAKGLAPLKAELERIDAIQDYAALAVYFGSALKRGFESPFVLSQFGDMKNPQYYGIYAYQAGLGLPDREYYLSSDEKSAVLRKKYVAHIARMFELAKLPDPERSAAAIMVLETRLAGKQMRKEDLRDFAKNYSKVRLGELGVLMPRFNWSGYVDEVGITEIDGLIVLTGDYMRALDEILVDTSLDTWRIYLKWGALNAAADRLTAELDDQNFEFYGKTLVGIQEQRPMWRRGVSLVNRTLGEIVGRVYVREHFPPEAKDRMLELVDNLIKAYEVSIRDLDWMSDGTKKEALDKLAKFTPKVGYPDKWRDYSAVTIRADDLYGNIERANIAEYRRVLDRQGGPVDREEWGMTPQTVNAYYMPTLNQIVFPAAILQPPFFDLEADDAVNYGAIGAVIGHEIGHGFDDKGSTFDGDGMLRNWWTDADRSEFEARTATLVEQYSSFKVFDDLNVNGEYTLGENIGDLGGLSIALLAYRLSLGERDAPVIDGFTGVQRVFLGWGQVWRNKYREEALRHRVATDSHSPSRFRANGTVRNVPEFYEAFDVAAGDALYLSPERRVKIW